MNCHFMLSYCTLVLRLEFTQITGQAELLMNHLNVSFQYDSLASPVSTNLTRKCIVLIKRVVRGQVFHKNVVMWRQNCRACKFPSSGSCVIKVSCRFRKPYHRGHSQKIIPGEQRLCMLSVLSFCWIFHRIAHNHMRSHHECEACVWSRMPFCYIRFHTLHTCTSNFHSAQLCTAFLKFFFEFLTVKRHPFVILIQQKNLGRHQVSDLVDHWNSPLRLRKQHWWLNHQIPSKRSNGEGSAVEFLYLFPSLKYVHEYEINSSLDFL